MNPFKDSVKSHGSFDDALITLIPWENQHYQQRPAQGKHEKDLVGNQTMRINAITA